MSESIVSTLIEKGSVTAICIALLWFVAKRLFKLFDEHTAAYRERVETLEKRAEECESDRRKLNERHADLQRDVIKTLGEKVVRRE